MIEEFGKVTPSFVRELIRIVGERGVIYEDKDALEAYSHDESAFKYYARMPDVVVKPEKVEQISEIMKLANEEKIPVTPRGAGSGLSGGCIPLFGGIVLSLERMNRVIEVDKKNLVAVVEPGVVTNDLCRRVMEEGLYYAGYPMSVETSFIGGNVATNAGGSKVIKYGSTGHHVLGIEAVFPNGEVVIFGGKRRKDSSGYNFVKLLVGSEGTLAVFSKIYLNLIPLPGKTVDLLIPFKKVEDAVDSVPLILMESKELPSALEFIDKVSIELSAKYNNTSFPFQGEAEAFLIVQLEGKNRTELENIYEKVGKALLSKGAIDVFVADNRSASESIWKVRRTWLEALKAVDPYVSTGDVVLPTSSIPDMMSFLSEMSNEYKVKIPVAAHVADGNLHPAPLKPSHVSLEEWRYISEEILDKLALKAAELGGAVSGEHGIGLLKKRVLNETKRKEVELMKKMKRVFDPNNIMNPGKIF
ncbi:MAG: FAD-binding oxidoreductase [Synergistetes bacterium]|nr:FAD-binding oxidoreductase [Synergistota bacterium]MCX8127708.1 FAD-binding oxidoreductase [Synergistota bacterium]MDW8191377.1 FAD-binding oxidoreductase [Synergistota bacterium]